MTLHLSAYRLWLHTAIATAIMLLALATRAVALPVGPQLNYALPVGLIVPAVAATVTTFGARSEADALASQSPRSRASLLGTRLAVGAGTPATVVIVVAGAAPGSDTYGAVVVRNFILCLGIAFLMLGILGRLWFWLPLCTYVIACMVVGVTDLGGVEPWAIIALPDLDESTVVPALALLIVGWLAFLVTARRPST